MAGKEFIDLASGEILDEAFELSLAELCRACRLPAERVVELVEYGVIEPAGSAPDDWRFQSISIRRVHSAERLTRDLGVNVAGVALALELLDELNALRSRVRRLADSEGGD